MSSTAVELDGRTLASQRVPQDLYRLLVLRNSGSEILVASDRPPFTLPCVEIPRWERVAENLSQAVRTRYGISAICLFTPEPPNATTDGEPPQYQVVETREAGTAVPDEMRWLPLDSISDQSFADEQDRLAVTDMLRQIAGFQSGEAIGPFGRPGWIEELVSWAQRESEPYGLRLTGKFRQLNASPTFSLIRFETNAQAVWFKAVGDPNLREFPISLTLARLFPGFVPTVIATRPDLNSWLSLEFGSATLDETADDRAWKLAAETLGRLQIDSLGKTEQLVKAGCRDLGVTSLLSMVGLFMEVMSQLMERQQATPPQILDRSELRYLGAQIREALADWGDLGVPDTLGHLDFNPGNIRRTVDQCVFLDWAEAYVGPPFPTFQFLVEHARQRPAHNAACLRQLITSYSTPWFRIASPATVAEAQALTPLTAAFLYAVALDAWHDGERLKTPRLAGLFSESYSTNARRIRSVEGLQIRITTSSHHRCQWSSSGPLSCVVEVFAMLMLVLRAYLELIRVDVRVSRQGFAALYRKVQRAKIAGHIASSSPSERVCRTMDLACVWYWKQVLCLQRSAATTCLLRRYGVAAQMVIGTQQIPFAAHAWVEVDGAVVTDKPYMREMYAVLDTW